MSNWICNAPWNSIVFYADNTIAPCCQYKSHTDISSFDNVHTFNTIQQEMINGNIPNGCSACKKDETDGVISYRQDVYGDDPMHRNTIKYIDVRNDNNCNLKCRICGPEYSSSWGKLLNTPLIKHTNVFNLIQPLLTNDIVDIYFTGGEPFLNPTHYTILKDLDSKNLLPSIRLRYNTNLTTLSLNNKDVLYYWKKANTVLINGSLEAIGEPLENIRSGAKWAKIDKNIKKIHRLNVDHIKLKIVSTVGALNVWFLTDLFNYCHSHEIELQLQELYDPDFLTINALPIEIRNVIIRQLSELYRKHPHDTLKSIIDNIDIVNDEHLFTHLISHVLYLDRKNNEKLFDLLPLEDYTNQYILYY
jgi:molybdenum cofactor biosynthesis enzyme MoaA